MFGEKFSNQFQGEKMIASVSTAKRAFSLCVKQTTISNKIVSLLNYEQEVVLKVIHLNLKRYRQESW